MTFNFKDNGENSQSCNCFPFLITQQMETQKFTQKCTVSSRSSVLQIAQVRLVKVPLIIVMI